MRSEPCSPALTDAGANQSCLPSSAARAWSTRSWGSADPDPRPDSHVDSHGGHTRSHAMHPMDERRARSRPETVPHDLWTASGETLNPRVQSSRLTTLLRVFGRGCLAFGVGCDLLVAPASPAASHGGSAWWASSDSVPHSAAIAARCSKALLWGGRAPGVVTTSPSAGKSQLHRPR